MLRSNGQIRRAPGRKRSHVQSFPGRNLQDPLPRVPLPQEHMFMPTVLNSPLPKHLVGPRSRQMPPKPLPGMLRVVLRDMCDAHPKLVTVTTTHMRYRKHTLKDPEVPNASDLIRAPLHPVVEIRERYVPHKGR
eukprot:4627441-Pyramimonas_sp.AAC.2